jgi:membrane protease YdiL (CAAX protease family)
MATGVISRLWATDSPPVGRLVVLWATAGAFASIAVLPYAIALQPALFARIPVPFPLFVVAQLVQAFVLLGLLSWAGLRLGRSLGLTSPIAHAVAYKAERHVVPVKTLGLAALAGGLTGAMLLVLDKVFAPFMPGTMQTALPDIALSKRFLASFYGGITEELICRLFLMTLIVWLSRKWASRTDSLPTPSLYWIGIVGAAFLFGLAHLPAAAAVWPLTTFVIARVLILNCIGGIVFGWLYWRRGLEHAMVAHFVADIVLHVIGGL